MFYCLTASTARALLCMANAEFGIQVMAEAVVACPEKGTATSLTEGEEGSAFSDAGKARSGKGGREGCWGGGRGEVQVLNK